MAQATAIEWTDLSWNPVHGCSKVSPGCAHCYAETLSLRYGQTPKPWTPANAADNVILKPHKLPEPLSGAKQWEGLGPAAAAAGKTDGMLVFVNSMSDLFHEEIPDEYIAHALGVMAAAPQHTFQVLTKRPHRMRDLLAAGSGSDFWGDVWRHAADVARADVPAPALLIDGQWFLTNVWLGVSIENRRFVHRADLLRETPAAVRFVSAEPLLGPLVYDSDIGVAADRDWSNAATDEHCGVPPHLRGDPYTPAWGDGADLPELDLEGIDWLIVGGESGPGHRPMREEWVRDLRDASIETDVGCSSCEGCASIDCEQCGGTGRLRGTAFFFKQWGGSRPGGDALLDGREWREFPEVASA